MRWAYKDVVDGTYRIITRFAWLPIVTNLPIKQYIWLELYKVEQRYGCSKRWRDVTIAPKEYWKE